MITIRFWEIPRNTSTRI